MCLTVAHKVVYIKYIRKKQTMKAIPMYHRYCSSNNATMLIFDDKTDVNFMMDLDRLPFWFFTGAGYCYPLYCSIDTVSREPGSEYPISTIEHRLSDLLLHN